MGVFCFGKHRIFQLVCKLQDLFDKRPVSHGKDLPQQRADPGRIFCKGNGQAVFFADNKGRLEMGEGFVIVSQLMKSSGQLNLQIKGAEQVGIDGKTPAELLFHGNKPGIVPLCQKNLPIGHKKHGGGGMEHQSTVKPPGCDPFRDLVFTSENCRKKSTAYVQCIQKHALKLAFQSFFLCLHPFPDPLPVSGKKSQPHFKKILTEKHAPLFFLKSSELCPFERKRDSCKISLKKKTFCLRQIFGTASVPVGETVIIRHTFLHICHYAIKTARSPVIHGEDAWRTEGPGAGAAHGGGLFRHKIQCFPVMKAHALNVIVAQKA